MEKEITLNHHERDEIHNCINFRIRFLEDRIKKEPYAKSIDEKAIKELRLIQSKMK